MGPEAETEVRAGPPPGVTYADPQVLERLRRPMDVDWKLYADATGVPASEVTPKVRAIVPHRGGTILVYGLLALLPFLHLVFGILAITRSDRDLREMSFGHMDPRGEELTRWGRTLGFIGVFAWTLLLMAMCLGTPNRF